VNRNFKPDDPRQRAAMPIVQNVSLRTGKGPVEGIDAIQDQTKGGTK
jgi:hypothetical protein